MTPQNNPNGWSGGAHQPLGHIQAANDWRNREAYTGAELRAHVRPNAMDAYRLPSIVNGQPVAPKGVRGVGANQPKALGAFR